MHDRATVADGANAPPPPAQRRAREGHGAITSTTRGRPDGSGTNARIAADLDAFRDDAAMSLTSSEFVTALTSEVPETTDTVLEHLTDQDGDLLLHLLMGDLGRLAIDWFRTERTEALERLFSVLERALREGDEYVKNAAAVSFVEDLGWWEPDIQTFIAVLPGELAKEVERQRLSNG